MNDYVNIQYVMESRRIRQEQDEAYAESLRIDSAKVNNHVIFLYCTKCLILYDYVL